MQLDAGKLTSIVNHPIVKGNLSMEQTEVFKMKKWNVESRRDYAECFDNYCSDYIEAATEDEAIELYKQWLIENGCDPEEVENYEYRAKEYWH